MLLLSPDKPLHAAASTAQLLPLAFYCVLLIVNKSLGHTFPDRPIVGVVSDSSAIALLPPLQPTSLLKEFGSSALESPALERKMLRGKMHTYLLCQYTLLLFVNLLSIRELSLALV